MSNGNVIYLNKSRWEVDTRCQRQFYWNYIHDGTGIVKSGDQYNLVFGITYHEAATHYWVNNDLEVAIGLAHEGLQRYFIENGIEATLPIKEQLYLIEGLLRALPLSKHYTELAPAHTIKSVEVEYPYRDGEFLFTAKPDVLLERTDDSKLVYIEYKTTSYVSENWFKPYKRAPQLMGAALAIEQNLNQPLDHTFVQPVWKGKPYKGIYDHPFCYIWRDTLSFNAKYSIKRPSSYKGWERVGVWDIGENWFDILVDLGVIDTIYPIAPPIFINREVVDQWWEQTKIRWCEIDNAANCMNNCSDDVKAILLNTAFQQDFTTCEPMIGWDCPYLNCCWIKHIGADPLNYGFELNQPHSEFDPLMNSEGSS